MLAMLVLWANALTMTGATLLPSDQASATTHAKPWVAQVDGTMLGTSALWYLLIACCLVLAWVGDVSEAASSARE